MWFVCVWQTGKVKYLFTLQTKGYSDWLYVLRKTEDRQRGDPLSICPLSFFVYLLFLQRTHSLKLIFHGPLLIVWSQSCHIGAMATGGVYPASECKFATFDDTSRMRGLRERQRERESMSVCILYLSQLFLQKATRVRNRVISAVKLYEQYWIQKWEIITDTTF